jgi:hypothetical protein
LKKALALFLIVFAWMDSATAPSPASATGQSNGIGQIVVSLNGRLLQYEDGRPFFWLGGTAWNLFERLDRDETGRYLEDRRLKGFNVIQAVAFHGSDEKYAYGSDALLESDADCPNAADDLQSIFHARLN